MKSNLSARGSIGRRLALVQAGVLVIALIGSALGYWGLSRVAARTAAMYDDAIVTERVASDWFRNVFNGVTRTTAPPSAPFARINWPPLATTSRSAV